MQFPQVLGAFQARAMSQYFRTLIGNGVAYFPMSSVLVTSSGYAVTVFRCHVRVRNLFEVIVILVFSIKIDEKNNFVIQQQETIFQNCRPYMFDLTNGFFSLSFI